MEIIRGLVQSIAMIVILAVFLEMLLPAGDMRRYLRLVFGILVMISVLQAVFSLLNKEGLTFDVPAVIIPQEGIADLSGQLEDIMDEGSRIHASEQDRAMEEYRLGLARQIYSLASLNGTVKVVGVQVRVEDDRQSPTYGRLLEVCLELHSGVQTGSNEAGNNSGEKGIEPIEIRIGDPEPTDPQIAEKIKVIIADFYNLPRDSVRVIYR